MILIYYNEILPFKVLYFIQWLTFYRELFEMNLLGFQVLEQDF